MPTGYFIIFQDLDKMAIKFIWKSKGVRNGRKIRYGVCYIRDQDLLRTRVTVRLHILWREEQINRKNRELRYCLMTHIMADGRAAGQRGRDGSQPDGQDNWSSTWRSDPFLTPQSQINFQWIKDLDVNGKMLKLLEDNVEDYLYDFKIEKDLLKCKMCSCWKTSW